MKREPENGAGGTLLGRARSGGAEPGSRARRDSLGRALAGSLLLHAGTLGGLLVFGSLAQDIRPGSGGPGSGPPSLGGHVISILPVDLLASGGPAAATAAGDPKLGVAAHASSFEPELPAGRASADAPPPRDEPEQPDRFEVRDQPQQGDLPQRSEEPKELRLAAADPPSAAPAGLSGVAPVPEASGGASAAGAHTPGVGRAGSGGYNTPSGGGGFDGEGGGEGKEGNGASANAGESDLVPPTPLHLALPGFPAGIDRERARGTRVTLAIHVLDSGEINDVKVLSSSGIDALDESALGAGRRLRYAPGTENGEPISMWAQTEITF